MRSRASEEVNIIGGGLGTIIAIALARQGFIVIYMKQNTSEMQIKDYLLTMK